MDVTPRELRDVEIRDAFRGYHKDDVDELLERAAATIEGQAERIRQLGARLGSAEDETTRTREASDVLQRTLVLAQKAADEAVAESREQARRTIEDAEACARQVLAEAEGEAQRRAEASARRLEAQVLDLAERRERLQADIDALERFETSYRGRLRDMIEGDLRALDERRAVVPGTRPEVSSTTAPPVGERVLAREEAAPPPAPPERPPTPPGPATQEYSLLADEPTPGGMPIPVPPAPPTPGAGSAARERADAGPEGEAAAGGAERHADPGEEPGPPEAAAPRDAVDAADARDDAADAPAVMADAPGRPGAGDPPPTLDLYDAERDAGVARDLDDDGLDDDAFFASLREAVRDDAPLGPRDDFDEEAFFRRDPEQEMEFRDVFKRRR